MGNKLFGYGVRFARLLVAATLMLPVLSGQWACAENWPQSSPVPQKLLLRFLVDNETFTLVDARTSSEFEISHINGAVNVPHDSTDDVLSSLPSDLHAPIVIYCKTGKRARHLQEKLLARGYTNVRVLLPEQIFWFDDMAVFNCSTPAPASNTITKPRPEVNREGIL